MKLTGVLSATIAAAALLTACGGGGGAGGGNPIPQTTPKSTSGPTSYKVHILWTGGDALASKQSRNTVRTHVFAVRRTMDDSQAGQLPVIMPVQAPSDSYFYSPGVSAGTATVEVSPQPNTDPSATFDPTGVAVTVNPIPTPSGQSTAPPQAGVQADPNATPGSGTLGVTLTGSVQQSVSVPVYIVGRANIACSNTPLPAQRGSGTLPADQVGGVAFVSGQANPASTTAAADLYIDGSTCSAVGFLNASDANPTIYAPYGAILLSSAQTAYADVTPSQWTNSFTSMSVTTLMQSLTDPNTPTDILLINTASGKTVKIALNSVQSAPQAAIDFSFEQDGFAQDGF